MRPPKSSTVLLSVCMITRVMLAPSVPAQSTSPQTKAPVVAPPTTKQRTGDLDALLKYRVIRIGVPYSKTLFYTVKGAEYGISYEMGKEFEKYLNKKYPLENKNLRIHVLFTVSPREKALSYLNSGSVDVLIGGISITPERQKLVDFSAPVYRNVSEVVVSGPASPAVSSLDDLAGKEVFVRTSSIYHESLVALNRRFAAEQKPAVIIKEAPEELEDEDLIEMVSAGLIPLIVVDKHKADFWKKIFPKITVHDAVALRSGADIAWAIRKGSPQLKAALDDFTTRRGKTAEVNTILTRYLKNTKYVKDAASKSERKKFLALVRYFQKYGDQYHVDWLLMAAQGYQESQLNQAARSPVGAIGVMQIMPATGEDLGVGDISQTEPNIHAGVKYMRWMIDNYYGDEPMTQLDKALFAFASYNAGAGRIAQLRKAAAKRGLDPNVWFDNVEYLAAEKIGAETVTYVSNIYKYYIAYRLILDAREQKEEAIEKMKGLSKGTP